MVRQTYLTFSTALGPLHRAAWLLEVWIQVRFQLESRLPNNPRVASIFLHQPRALFISS